MIRTVWRSNAALAIAPMQDFLNLGTSARMNQPAVPEGNWQWRMHPGCLSPQLMDWIRTLNSTFGRENSK
jgi:4-alpha-glucanotransferase